MAFIKHSIGKIASIVEGNEYLDEQVKKVQEDQNKNDPKEREVVKSTSNKVGE